MTTQCQDSENSCGALGARLPLQAGGACAQTHMLTSWWHPGESDLLPDSPRKRRVGKRYSREVSTSGGGSIGHVTVLGRLRLPPPPSRKPGPLTLRPPRSRGNGPVGFRNSLGSHNWYQGSGTWRSPVLVAKAEGAVKMGGDQLPSPRKEAGRRRGGGEVTWGVARAACARHLTRRPAPSSCGAGGREEGRQDGGGEVGRAGRCFCRRHLRRRRRRLRSCCLRLLTRSPTGRSCSGVGFAGESKSSPQPFSPSTLVGPNSLPLPPALLGVRVRPVVGGGGYFTTIWASLARCPFSIRRPPRWFRCLPPGSAGSVGVPLSRAG